MADKKHKEDRKRIFESKRFKVMAFCAMAAILIGSTATFAWYGVTKREADSESAEVMKPYYLTLLNPSETDSLQLAIGNLFPGDVKQIVFCVSNKNNEKSGLEMGVTTFNYSIELIHTENLALQYRIYELQAAEEGEDGAIAALDTVTVTNEGGETTEENKITYWKKTLSTPLTGVDVSELRHTQAGITNEEGTLINANVLPVNAGEYISYEKDSQNKALCLEAGEKDGNPTFDSQYFLIEIDWEEGADEVFEKYEKETDMIYLLVEALQPEPEKKTTQITTD